MSENYFGRISLKTFIAVVTLLVTYFTVVSTFTNARVSDIELKVENCTEKSVVSERNIAVILEKISNIESMLLMLRDEIRQTHAGGQR